MKPYFARVLTAVSAYVKNLFHVEAAEEPCRDGFIVAAAGFGWEYGRSASSLLMTVWNL